jgi:hypothetical protein
MKKIIILIIIILFFVAVFALGFFTNNIFYQKNILKCSQNYCYNQGWESARRFVVGKYSTNDSGGTIDANRNFINGKITEVQNNKIIVEYKGFEILPSQDLITREVNLNNNTEIDKLAKKDDKAYALELSILKNKTENSKQPDSPENYPAKYSYIKALFADFKVGQDVYIQSDKNIQDQKIFTASIIKILD